MCSNLYYEINLYKFAVVNLEQLIYKYVNNYINWLNINEILQKFIF